jgi:hypothetical protein
MEISKYRLSTSNLDQVVNFLVANLPFDYENHSKDMSVLAQEEYHLRSSSTQLNMIIAKRQEDIILLDIMGMAGGAGMFNFDFGSEKGYLRKVCVVLERYCEEFGLGIEEIAKE